MKNNNKRINNIAYELEQKNCFSIHTITYRISFTDREYYDAKQKLHMKNKGNKEYSNIEEFNGMRKKIITYVFGKNKGFDGIELWIYKGLNEGESIVCRSGLDLKINIRKCLGITTHPFACIAPYDRLQEVPDIIDKFIKDIGIAGINISLGKVMRMDICANIDLGSEENVDLYMKLIKKGLSIKRTKHVMEYDKIAKRTVKVKNSFTIRNKSYEFSVYRKYRQMEQDRYVHDKETMRDVSGKIRIEYRLMRNKIKDILGRYGMDSDNDLFRKVNEIGVHDISKIIKRCFGSGDFMTYAAAQTLIDSSNYRDKKKALMYDVLAKVEEGGLDKAEKYVEKYGYKIESVLKDFNEIDISPITIPGRAKVKILHNPLYCLIYSNCNDYL